MTGWTAPATPAAGAKITTAFWWQQVRDNELVLADGTWGRDVGFRYKAANESVVATTTVQNDDNLVFPVAANALYLVSVGLFVEANNLNDAKFGWSLPASATFNMLKNAPSTGIASGTSAGSGDWGGLIGAVAATMNVGITDGSVTLGVELKAVINTAATAGNANLQWAQVVSGSTLTVRGGSWLEYKRIG